MVVVGLGKEIPCQSNLLRMRDACGPDSFLELLIPSAVCGNRLFITFICPECQETIGIYGWWHNDSPTTETLPILDAGLLLQNLDWIGPG
jgi:hypothetical protein